MVTIVFILGNTHIHLPSIVFLQYLFFYKELRGTVLTCLRQSNICNSIKKSTVQTVFIAFLLILIFRSLGF